MYIEGKTGGSTERGGVETLGGDSQSKGLGAWVRGVNRGEI